MPSRLLNRANVSVIYSGARRRPKQRIEPTNGATRARIYQLDAHRQLVVEETKDDQIERMERALNEVARALLSAVSAVQSARLYD